MVKNSDESLREREAAIILGLAPNTLAHWRISGAGPPFVKLGRSVRYPRDLLLAWRDKRIRRSTSDSDHCAG